MACLPTGHQNHEWWWHLDSGTRVGSWMLTWGKARRISALPPFFGALNSKAKNLPADGISSVSTALWKFDKDSEWPSNQSLLHIFINHRAPALIDIIGHVWPILIHARACSALEMVESTSISHNNLPSGNLRDELSSSMAIPTYTRTFPCPN